MSTPDEQPRNCPPVELRQLPAAAIHALAGGDLPTASAEAGLVLSEYFVSDADRRTWRRRSEQIRQDPVSAGWITRIILDTDRGLVTGRAGFHGPPDSDGMVEVGYSVDPTHRRRGYARAALLALLERAAREPDVRTVRATISPNNLASQGLILQQGFVPVGEQWDDEDGLETIYERPAGTG